MQGLSLIHISGYIGDDIESVVSKLLAAADNDVEKAETGIIFIEDVYKRQLQRLQQENFQELMYLEMIIQHLTEQELEITSM